MISVRKYVIYYCCSVFTVALLYGCIHRSDDLRISSHTQAPPWTIEEQNGLLREIQRGNFPVQYPLAYRALNEYHTFRTETGVK